MSTTRTHTASSVASTTAASNALTTAVVPVYVWSMGESLLSHYFPTTTPLDMAEVSWPTQVVLGTATYNLKGASTTTSATSSPSPTEAGHSSQQHDPISDKRLGIILGAVIGAIAIAVMAIVFCCLRRRRKYTGSYFMRRSTTPSSGGSRRATPFGTSSFLSPTQFHQRQMSAGDEHFANRGIEPAIVHHQSSRSTSDDRPFITPQERSTATFDQHELEAQRAPHTELDHHSPSQRQSFHSTRDPRPQTPFSPMMMMGMNNQPSTSNKPHPALTTNPFSSPEDREADDVVSPILPSKSPERRYSPMVHYPSMSEVSEFDFAGDGRREQNDDGGDGWHPAWERVHGRHELA